MPPSSWCRDLSGVAVNPGGGACRRADQRVRTSVTVLVVTALIDLTFAVVVLATVRGHGYLRGTGRLRRDGRACCRGVTRLLLASPRRYNKPLFIRSTAMVLRRVFLRCFQPSFLRNELIPAPEYRSDLIDCVEIYERIPGYDEQVGHLPRLDGT